MAKNLVINCSSCDARKVQEEAYAEYESITINCASVITNTQGKTIMNRLPFTVNCANVLELEDSVELRTINGTVEIKSSDAVGEKKYYLAVNGTLTIGPDTQRQLAQYTGMSVNGSLVCPESIYAALPAVKVNGSTACYPDGAIVLKRNAVIDKLFALRAKNRLYWSGKRMIFVDPALDGDALREKGASFSAQEVIIAQSKVESLIDLIDEKAEIIIVPDNTAVVLDDVTLDEDTLRRFGSSLYIIGDVKVPEKNPALSSFTYLNIRGDAKVPEEFKDAFYQAVTEISGEVKFVKSIGAVLEDKPFVKLTKWMLEQQPLGIKVEDCAFVTIEADIPKDWILQRLQLEDCAVVKCSPEQEDAVTMVSTDVAKISTSKHVIKDSLGDLVSAALGSGNDGASTKVINASDYVL
jgi:hypothetical protein